MRFSKLKLAYHVSSWMILSNLSKKIPPANKYAIQAEGFKRQNMA